MAHVRKHLTLSDEHWDADVLIWPEFALTLYGGEAARVTASCISEASKAKPMSSLVCRMCSGRTMKAIGCSIPPRALVWLQGSLRNTTCTGLRAPQSYLRGLSRFLIYPCLPPVRAAEQGDCSAAAWHGVWVSAAMGICYEIAYGESLRRNAVDSGVLLTISNIGLVSAPTNICKSPRFGPWKMAAGCCELLITGSPPSLTITATFKPSCRNLQRRFCAVSFSSWQAERPIVSGVICPLLS